MINRIFNFFKNDSTKKNKDVVNIGCPYRFNRIIRSKYQAGDYVIVNEHLCHYGFYIDESFEILGIVEVLSAIKALEEAGQ
ncbi:hypothetical protein NVP1123O_18 [Vibrio phage 1.123.O._10N.286.48.F3]|nr:hypothetical protein NVP1123O_18 [Vibrio phage 1.123.O._10N.286.48.F3]